MKRFFASNRIATYVLLLFCAGHTAGGMLAQKSMGPASDAVFAAMKQTHFTFNGSDSTWYGFWFGFGLMASVYLLLCAYLAWHLEQASTNIAWALAASLAVTAVLSFRYFFVGPGVLATLATALIIAATLRRLRRHE